VATSATFSGSVTVPSVAISDNNTKAATTAQVKSYVDSAVSGISIGSYAPLASPAFSGTPTAPTPPTTENGTRIATTAFVKSVLPTVPAAPDLSSYATKTYVDTAINKILDGTSGFSTLSVGVWRLFDQTTNPSNAGHNFTIKNSGKTGNNSVTVTNDGGWYVVQSN
jgi:hypothetical protein